MELDFQSKPVDWVFILPFDGMADAEDVDIDDTSGDDLANEAVSSMTTEEAG